MAGAGVKNNRMSFDDLFDAALEENAPSAKTRRRKSRAPAAPAAAEADTPERQPDTPPQPRIFTVSELTRDIRTVLEDYFPAVWVCGEVSTLRLPQSGHIYFTLKDDRAQLKCVMFRSANQRLPFKLEDGLSCVVCGRVSVYEQSGQYQLYVQKIEPRGKGALQVAFEQLKQKLAAEGLFDPARKRLLPVLPRTIGIATSATGAAIRDILQVVRRRYSNVHIIIRPCLVQGATAAPDIARAIEELNAYGGIDVLIVGRGGGSFEDLWPFNEEIVARAVAASRIPVISAVGHEIDFTVCDFVADVRAPTPSAAAELVVPEKEKLQAAVAAGERRMREAMRQRLRMAGMRFSRVCASYALRRPQVMVEQYLQRLDNLERVLRMNLTRIVQSRQERLSHLRPRLSAVRTAIDRADQLIERREQAMSGSIAQKVRRAEQEMKAVGSRLAALNPLAVLSRGYSITSDAGGRVVKDAAAVRRGDLLKTKLRKGAMISRVEECEP
ncbi:MAG: exodeoxyribonuclease VII large subunit [Candidatus Omnitrophica bacterium]|nr:exodeoxyribonuclease VII large subunit [Candidatus Omnitrophota bacterium]